MPSNITISQFITKYKGTVCKHPLGKTGMCVCLIRCYFDEVLGVPQFPGVIGAKNLWDAIDQTKFTRVKNTILGKPPEGAIVIMDAFKGNPNGHVFIALNGATIWNVPAFESNWAISQRATLGNHGYLNPRIIGWLVKK